MTLTVRCTREEYLNFCVETAPRPVWTIVAGVVSALCAVTEAMLLDGLTQVGLLLMFCAVLCLLMNPLIIPMWCKGTAGRRYDNSDDVKNAMHVTFSEQTVTIDSEAVKATIPMTAVTRVIKTKTMLAVQFGNELTVWIPRRAMTETQAAAVTEMLQKGMQN